VQGLDQIVDAFFIQVKLRRDFQVVVARIP
jgi:hypothetical protein